MMDKAEYLAFLCGFYMGSEMNSRGGIEDVLGVAYTAIKAWIASTVSPADFEREMEAWRLRLIAVMEVALAESRKAGNEHGQS